jgi:hypothetical protein
LTWVDDRLSTCLSPPPSDRLLIAAHLVSTPELHYILPYKLQYDPKKTTTALSFFPHPTGYPKSGTTTDSHTQAQRPKGPNTLNLAKPAAASSFPTTHHPAQSPEIFFPSPSRPRTHARRSAARPFSHLSPPNFPPFSDGDIIAIWKIPPRTLRSLTDPDYAQLPAIALAIGRSVFRGCDCLKLDWATRERETERERI